MADKYRNEKEALEGIREKVGERGHVNLENSYSKGTHAIGILSHGTFHVLGEGNSWDEAFEDRLNRIKATNIWYR